MVRLHSVQDCDEVKMKVVTVWLDYTEYKTYCGEVKTKVVSVCLDYTQNVTMVVIYIAVLV